MSLINAVLGNASEIDVKELDTQLNDYLIDGEKVERAWKLIRDYFIFTDLRLILIDKQGVTGTKVEYHSIPYKNISHFSVETVGNFDLDSELKLYIRDYPGPLIKKFKKGSNLSECQRTLAGYILDK